MNNKRIPARPAPTQGFLQNILLRQKSVNHVEKKKPPPRPPPPNFNKIKSKSAWNLHQNQNVQINLLEWSPPSSPKAKKHPFSGSVSSSFSSSTSSLASSKKSLEYETVPINQNPWNNNVPFPFPSYGLQARNAAEQHVPPKITATIIKPAIPQKKWNSVIGSQQTSLVTNSAGSRNWRETSPPMPNVAPPSPPKCLEASEISPFGIAMYPYEATQPGDLELQVNDIVYLLRKVNEDWFYGRVDDKEGIFPSNFIDVQVPLTSLSEQGNIVTALYEFKPQMKGDLELKPGYKVKVIKMVTNEWYFGECNGSIGQFPANFIDRIPDNIRH